MAYGSDITEGLPYNLSNPVGATSFSSTGEAYDVSINALPFFMATKDETPYRRQTAQYRKNQIDQSAEPGEQSITGWWVRSQSSFHMGAGIKFYDPSAGEAVAHRFYDSQGCNVWTKGTVTLLKDVDRGHVITTALSSNGREANHIRSITWSGTQGLLLHDGYDLDKIFPTITASVSNKALTTNVATLTTSSAHGFAAGMEVVITGVDAVFNGTYTIATVPTTTTFTYAKTNANVTSTAVSPVGSATSNVIHYTDYTAGTDEPVYAVCDDGIFAYFITNKVEGGANKLHMFKKPLTGTSLTGLATSPPTGDVTLMFTATGTLASNATMEYVKERIVLCLNNSVYEIPTTATALPTAVYTHPNTLYVYTSVSASGPAIYVTGFNGIISSIQKFTLASNGTMPALTSAITAAELPPGEVCYKIFSYLGYMMIGTSKGVRVALINDQDGSLSYGPLIIETTQPCYDFAARDRFVWCATNANGTAGVIRIDLSAELPSDIAYTRSLRFAYANDLQYTTDTTHPTVGVAFMGSSNQLGFITAYADTSNGYVHVENPTRLVSTGYITAGRIRYATLENKVFKLMKARVDNTNGGVNIKSIDSTGALYTIGSFSAGDFTPEVNVSYPVGAQEFMSFQFVINRSTTDTTKGCIFNGYQLKALPAIPRQRLIQYALQCYDSVTDSLGNTVGYEGAAYDNLKNLEAVENAGDTILVQDFRTGEAYTGLVEEINFINVTPSDKRFSGFGGTLLVTIRTI
jgi:hypothetical protein